MLKLKKSAAYLLSVLLILSTVLILPFTVSAAEDEGEAVTAGITGDWTWFADGKGTLYPVLHALEKEGCLESYWDEYENRKRRYYHITRKGKKCLNEKQREWQLFSNTVNRVLEFA